MSAFSMRAGGIAWIGIGRGGAEAERAVVIQVLADGGHGHGTRNVALVRHSSQPHRSLSASGASMLEAGASVYDQTVQTGISISLRLLCGIDHRRWRHIASAHGSEVLWNLFCEADRCDLALVKTATEHHCHRLPQDAVQWLAAAACNWQPLSFEALTAQSQTTDHA